MTFNIFQDQRWTGYLWLLARLTLGIFWLQAGLQKWGVETWTGSRAGTSVTGFLNGAIEKSQAQRPEVTAWFADLTRAYFLPNAELFSYLVVYGEILVGAALILGVAIRFSALMAVVMNLAFLLAGTSSSNPTSMTLGLALVVAGTSAGYYGIDHFAMPVVHQVWTKLTHRPAVRTAFAFGAYGVLAAVILAFGYTITKPTEWVLAIVAAVAIAVIATAGQIGWRALHPVRQPVVR